MKKYILIIIIAFAVNMAYSQCNEELVQICYPSLKNYTFLKSVPVKLKKAKKGEPPANLKKTFVFNAGVRYRITGCNASDYKGKMVIDLYSNEKLVASTFDSRSGNVNEGFEFDCKNPGVYFVICYFLDGQEGCAVTLISQLDVKR